jgi:hypothetical protein
LKQMEWQFFRASKMVSPQSWCKIGCFICEWCALYGTSHKPSCPNFEQFEFGGKNWNFVHLCIITLPRVPNTILKQVNWLNSLNSKALRFSKTSRHDGSQCYYLPKESLVNTNGWGQCNYWHCQNQLWTPMWPWDIVGSFLHHSFVGVGVRFIKICPKPTNLHLWLYLCFKALWSKSFHNVLWS